MPKIKWRAFTAGFKLQAVHMAVGKGVSVAEVCASLGLGETALRRWLIQYKSDGLGNPGPGLPITSEQRQIRELEMEMRQAKLDMELPQKKLGRLCPRTQVSSALMAHLQQKAYH